MTYYRHAFKTRDMTKEEQELYVGDFLSGAYETITGERLGESRRPKSDPPDRLFTWRGLEVGAEMFELEQFYGARAYLYNLVEEAYRQFDAIVADKRFAGVSARLPLQIGAETEALLKEHQQFHRLEQVAREFVALFMENVRSRDDIPNNAIGRIIRIDEEQFPALASLASEVCCSRCDFDLEKPTANAPHVMMGGSTKYSDLEMIAGIESTLIKKIDDLPRWPLLDRKLLVAHDLPRGYMYRGTKDWKTWLEIAAHHTLLTNHFDELWLVPVSRVGGVFGDGAGNAMLIASRNFSDTASS